MKSNNGSGNVFRIYVSAVNGTAIYKSIVETRINNIYGERVE